MDSYCLYGFPYDPCSPYGEMYFYDPNETQEERETRAFVGLVGVFLCFIGFPVAIAIGYGLYRLFS
jgi:hypothetical protein